MFIIHQCFCFKRMRCYCCCLFISVKQNSYDLRHLQGLQTWFMRIAMDQKKWSIQSGILFHFIISWRNC